MHFFDAQSKRLSEDIRSLIKAVMDEHEITLQDIADAYGVHHSTVSRWIKFDGDIHTPAALTPLLNSEKLFPLALAIIQFQAQPLNLIVTRRVEYGKLNGSLDDEHLAMMRTLGKMVDDAKANKVNERALRNEIRTMRELLDQAEQELNAKVK